MPNIKTILFVCTGNTCRSVMAEGLMKEMLKDRSDIKVSSSGVFAIPGFGSSKNAVEVCERRGIDISRHITRSLTDDAIKESDIILVMEKIHKDYILDKWAYCKDKVFLLADYGKGDETVKDGGDTGIPDPIGQSIETYQVSFNLIKESLDRLIKLL